MFKKIISRTAITILSAWLLCSSAVMASSQTNVVLIKNGLSTAQYTPQIMLLINYGSTTINLVDITNAPPTLIQFYSATSHAPTSGALPGGVTSYFYLPTNHAAITNYSSSSPFKAAIWCPVDTSTNGQNPNTSWFSNFCFNYPLTSGAPQTAVPAGVTLVEPFLSGQLSDTIDISEVNGVTAQWQVTTPNGGWVSGAFRDGSKAPHYPQIQWPHITNQPGSGSSYFGDYGNPGVYPFGCTTCVSRSNGNGIAAGCYNSGYKFFSYPNKDKGCDNAINPINPTFTAAPPGVASLPLDQYWHSGTVSLLNPGSGGYAMCQLGPSASNPVVRPGGLVQITLLKYPYGQQQTQDTSF
ncbi:MAG TPA: hypothetical protein V6C76_06250 [Drouetiella sp.]